MRDESGVLADRDHGASRRDEESIDVTHHDGQDGVVARPGQVHRRHGVINTDRSLVQDAGLPRQVRAVHVITGDSRDPVGGDAELLDEERL